MRHFERLDPRLLLTGNCTFKDDGDQVEEVADDLAAAKFADSTFTAETIRALDAGDTFATAYNLGQLGAARSLGGTVGGSDTLDVVKFSLGGASIVTLGLTRLRADIDIALYNSAGWRLAISNRAGIHSESIAAVLGAGTYYLVIAPYHGASSSYTLTTAAVAYAPTAPTPPTPPATPTTPPAPTAPTTPSTGVTPFADVPYYGATNEWNLNQINAPEAWARGYTGQGVVVAVIDTGVDLDHPELVDQLWVNAGEIPGNGIDDDGNGYTDDSYGWDFASNDNWPDDGNGHGTHVAGTIAAAYNGTGPTGVAWGASIMAVRVLGDNGSGTMSGVAAGIRYAVDNGADIINLSLGGSYSSTILAAMQYAQSRGVLIVAAAGNDYGTVPGYPARFSGSLSNVLSVGAHNSSGGIASFSNDVGTSGAVQVDAPGVSIFSTYVGGRHTLLSGTSMATPHVAALAALALSANPNLTAAQLRDLIVAGANRTIPGSDSLGGINAAMTVAMAAAGMTSASSASSTAVSSGVRTGPVAIRSFGSSSFDLAAVAAGLADVVDEAVVDLAGSPRLQLPTGAHASASFREAALASFAWLDNIDDAFDNAFRGDAEACDAWLDSEIDDALAGLAAELVLA